MLAAIYEPISNVVWIEAMASELEAVRNLRRALYENDERVLWHMPTRQVRGSV